MISARKHTRRTTAAASLAVSLTAGTAALADFVILDDLIVDGRTCSGDECANLEVFGDGEALKLKAGTTNILFEDTSAAPFPGNDWLLQINDPLENGLNQFSIHDHTAMTRPFLVEAGAPDNALYLDSDGNLGLGTSLPVTDLHVIAANAPTLRLEQDGSGGSDPQAWDVGADGSGFIIRDATNIRVPFELKAGAPNGALIVDALGNIALGGASPASLNVFRDNGTAQIRIEDTGAPVALRDLLVLENNGGPTIILKNSDPGALTPEWKLANFEGGMFMGTPTTAGPEFFLTNTGSLGLGTTTPAARIHAKAATGALADMIKMENNGDTALLFANTAGGAPTPEWKLASFQGNMFIGTPTSPGPEFLLSNTGNLTISGTLTTGSNTAYPDYVFEDDYQLMPLSDLDAYIAANGHLPKIPRAEQVAREGLNLTEMQIALLEKVEELTLYTLGQHETDRQQQELIRRQAETIAALEARLERLEN